MLAVDDNPTIHEDFRKILSKTAADRYDDLESAIFEAKNQPKAHEGFEVDSAFQGEEGLAKVRLAAEQGRPYAVAFVDNHHHGLHHHHRERPAARQRLE